jgi:hypothetical protein
LYDLSSGEDFREEYVTIMAASMVGKIVHPMMKPESIQGVSFIKASAFITTRTSEN